MTQRQVRILVTILGGILFGFSVVFFVHPEIFALGSFIVLGITLIALILYAYDTNRIANITEQRWESDRTPVPVYEMHYFPDHRLLVTLINISRYFARAWVSCNLRAYGKPVLIRADFDGQTAWRLFPYQSSTRVIALDEVLSRIGSSIDQLAQDAAPNNRENQLTIDLELRFENEVGLQRSSPPLRHFINIVGGRLVPVGIE